MQEAIATFTKILEGEGTEAQNNVAGINAAFALKCLHPEKSIEDCMALAKESLSGGKAFQALKKLISLQ